MGPICWLQDSAIQLRARDAWSQDVMLRAMCERIEKLRQVRIRDVKHIFDHRLRAAGVPFEERQDLLGHRSTRITTHYSAPDIARLLEAAERVYQPGLKTVLRIESHANGISTKGSSPEGVSFLIDSVAFFMKSGCSSAW